MAIVLTGRLIFARIDQLNRDVLDIKNSSALDAFQLFYEELVSAKTSTRIRRQRPVTSSK